MAYTPSTRISFTCSDSVADTLKRAAKVQNRSVSSLIAELLSDLEPGLRNVAEIGEKLDALTDEQKKERLSAVDLTDERLARPMHEAMDAYDELVQALRENPRPCNNGGKNYVPRSQKHEPKIRLVGKNERN